MNKKELENIKKQLEKLSNYLDDKNYNCYLDSGLYDSELSTQENYINNAIIVIEELLETF